MILLNFLTETLLNGNINCSGNIHINDKVVDLGLWEINDDNTSDIYYSNLEGNVGIGTKTPNANLEINFDESNNELSHQGSS